MFRCINGVIEDALTDFFDVPERKYEGLTLRSPIVKCLFDVCFGSNASQSAKEFLAKQL